MAAVGGHWIKAAGGARFVPARGPRRSPAEDLDHTLLGLALADPTPFNQYGTRESREYGAYILADGTVGRIDGEKANSSITFPDELVARLAGGHVSHTHPSGLSFSLSDIMLARQCNLASISAVGVDAGGRKWRYTLKPGPGGWKSAPNYINAKSIFNDQVYVAGWPRLEKAEAAGKATVTFRTALESWHRHKVMKLIAAQTGLEYRRERIR